MVKIREKIKKIREKEVVSKALKEEILAGAIIGIINNALHGRALIDTNAVMQKVTRMDLTNPLVFIVLGKILKIPALGTIGAFRLVNPSNITQEIQNFEETTEYKVYLR